MRDYELATGPMNAAQVRHITHCSDESAHGEPVFHFGLA